MDLLCPDASQNPILELRPKIESDVAIKFFADHEKCLNEHEILTTIWKQSQMMYGDTMTQYIVKVKDIGRVQFINELESLI